MKQFEKEEEIKCSSKLPFKVQGEFQDVLISYTPSILFALISPVYPDKNCFKTGTYNFELFY